MEFPSSFSELFFFSPGEVQVEQCYREPGIHGGYRATNLSLGQCLATLAPWNVNNETANVWTHTAACVVFLGRFLHMSRQVRPTWLSPLLLVLLLFFDIRQRCIVLAYTVVGYKLT